MKDQILWKHVFMRDFGGIKANDQTWEESVLYNEKEKNSYNTSQKQLIWAIRNHHISLVKKLHEKHPELIHCCRSRKRIPLYISAQIGNKFESLI